MTDGIFDPTSENVMRGGNRFMGNEAIDRSKMPPELTDGDVSAEEAAETTGEGVDSDNDGLPDVIDDEVRPTFDNDPDQEAENLSHIEVEDEGMVDLDGIEEEK